MNTIAFILQQNPLSLAVVGVFAAFVLWRVVKLAVKVTAILALVLVGDLAYRFSTGDLMLPAQEMGNRARPPASLTIQP
jgi:hypothetical protein